MAQGRLGWFLLAAGVASGAAGLVIVARARARSGLGRGRVVRGLAPPAPVVGQVRSGNKTVTHHRSENMPIEQRVRHIQDLVWKSVQLPEMRKLALQITKHCPERDGQCEARAVYDYVKKHVRYSGDVAPIKLGADGPVEAVDYYARADRVLENGAGDCDEQVTIVGTLAVLNGLPTMLRVTAPSTFGEWEHIFPVVSFDKLNPKRWTALDTTLPGSRFGVEVSGKRTLDFPI